MYINSIKLTSKPKSSLFIISIQYNVIPNRQSQARVQAHVHERYGRTSVRLRTNENCRILLVYI